MKRLILGAVWLAVLLEAGCSRYADFTLPPGGRQRAIAWRVREAVTAPVLERGAPGEWNSYDVLNPSVIRVKDLYYNLYSGFDGSTWHTGLATSEDGLKWARQGRVLSPDAATWEGGYIAANGSLLARNGEFFYWYQGGQVPRIGLARSADGRHWRKEPQPVLPAGPRGSWDERGVGDPYVAEFAGTLYMFFLGQDRAWRQRLGVARSADGLRWTKLRRNPILELGKPGAFDEVGLGGPAVWAQGGWYWMLYAGRDVKEHRKLGLARSRDGVLWERVSEAPVFSGGAAWNNQVVCDPTVELRQGVVRVWYGGGDVARPDEGLHGQIGFFELVEAGRE
ncbi:MAG: family 43 glycosylhydrolase [Bryobacteraceae bacterium]|jgi:predicted GH43/DUF377 family glycosyl hydrolase